MFIFHNISKFVFGKKSSNPNVCILKLGGVPISLDNQSFTEFLFSE